MKVTYSGKTKEFTPEVEVKVKEKLAKLAKMIEHRGEKCANVLHRQERHLHKVEIKVNFYDHSLLGTGSDADLMTAVCGAIEKLEKQIVRLRNRWRDTHRDARTLRANKENGSTAEEPGAPVNGSGTQAPAKVNGASNGARPRVFRVVPDGDTKPMTLEEAMMVMRKDEEYLIYHDQDRSSLSVLFRRRDGHYDLIEA